MSGPSPRRRHSPAVYRRRRVVLLLAIVAIAALVWVLIAQPWRGAANDGGADAAPAPTQAAATDLPVPNGDSAASDATPSASSETTPESEQVTTSSAPVCATDDISVEALSDQDSYGSGQNPQLSIRLTNEGTEDCTLNVGTSTQVFTITSGDDTWWRSTDCQTEPSDMPVLLAAGQAVTSATPIVWDRTRSDVATCADTNRVAAPGGGASYHLAVQIGGVSSSQSKQLLLY